MKVKEALKENGLELNPASVLKDAYSGVMILGDENGMLSWKDDDGIPFVIYINEKEEFDNGLRLTTRFYESPEGYQDYLLILNLLGIFINRPVWWKITDGVAFDLKKQGIHFVHLRKLPSLTTTKITFKDLRFE